MSLGLGAAGGALFAYFRMPLPWMVGAAFATTVAALSGVNLKLVWPLQLVMVAVLGVMLGSAFSPETLKDAFRWLGSFAGVISYVVAVGGCTLFYLYRKKGYDLPTAFFSSAPGGFSDMVILGAEMGADVRIISLIHSARIFFVVLTIPFAFRFFLGYEPSGFGVPGPSIASLTASDIAILTLCAVAGFWVAKLMRLPAPIFTGPILLSAAIHLGGLTDARPPAVLIAVAQVVLGTSIGCRFTGYKLKNILRTMATGAVVAMAMLAAALVFALVLERLTGLPFQALFLALSPGGMPEMSLISLAMNVDIAFVSSHHLGRIFVVVTVAPLTFHFLTKFLAVAKKSRAGK
jgi:hypothetical protein